MKTQKVIYFMTSFMNDPLAYLCSFTQLLGYTKERFVNNTSGSLTSRAGSLSPPSKAPSKSSIPFADDDAVSTSDSPMKRATPLLAITHPSIESQPESPFKQTKKSDRKNDESEPPKPKPTPPRTPGKGVSVISGKCVSGWL